MSKYPIFVFEGIEGTGKSTQVKSISVYLKKKRVPFIILREPGGSKNSEKIRKILLNKKSNFNPITDLLLYLASRSENIEKIINKNLNKKIILIDRFVYSTLAYQHYGMGINLKLIKYLNKLIIKKIKIKHIFLHTVDKKNLFLRLNNRKNKNRYDNFKYSFYDKVQKGFLKISKNKKKYVILNSNTCSIAEIKTILIKNINKLI